MKGSKPPRDPKDKAVDRRMRGLALGLIALAVIVIGYGSVVTIRPIYWKIYAELSHETAPVATQELNEKLVQALLRDVGENCSSRPVIHARGHMRTPMLSVLTNMQISKLKAVLQAGRNCLKRRQLQSLRHSRQQ